MLLLALVLFPLAEKVKHELGHLTEDHCDTKGIHFCALEHNCSICDYLISSSADTPPQEQNTLNISVQYAEQLKRAVVFNTRTSPKYTLSLRGPPVC